MAVNLAIRSCENSRQSPLSSGLEQHDEQDVGFSDQEVRQLFWQLGKSSTVQAVNYPHTSSPTVPHSQNISENKGISPDQSHWLNYAFHLHRWFSCGIKLPSLPIPHCRWTKTHLTQQPSDYPCSLSRPHSSKREAWWKGGDCLINEKLRSRYTVLPFCMHRETV